MSKHFCAPSAHSRRPRAARSGSSRVFYDIRDYRAADGAPADLRVFFPSLDGAVVSAPILAGCGRYPLILLMHGQCVSAVEQYKAWYLLPAQLGVFQG